MNFPKLTRAQLERRLTPPTGMVRMVLDTDTFNEIDDQFAVAYALLSPERLKVEAIYAAPFSSYDGKIGPERGMEESYQEILRLLERLKIPHQGMALRGSTTYLTGRDAAERSPAAVDLIERALTATEDEPLYVAAIGAITNVASAVLLEPEIIRRIVVVWLGGNPVECPKPHEFNLEQDLRASQLIFDCGLPLVHIPCLGVASHLLTTRAELDENIRGRNAVSDFLYQRFTAYSDDHFGWAKEIWDIAAIGWLLNESWVPSQLIPSPVLTDNLTYQTPPDRHPIRAAWYLNRNPIFQDMFRKLQGVVD